MVLDSPRKMTSIHFDDDGVEELTFKIKTVNLNKEISDDIPDRESHSTFGQSQETSSFQISNYT